MLLGCVFSFELGIYFFFSYFLCLFFIFFLSLLNERYLGVLFLQKSLKESETILDVNDFFDMNKITLYFFLFFFMLNGLILSFFYKFYQDFIYSSLGSGFSLTGISVFFVFILNCFFVLYLFIFESWFHDLKKNFLGFFFRYQEFLIFILLHIVSFFLFSCKDWATVFINIEILSFCFYIYTSFYGTIKPLSTFLKYSTNIRIMEAALKYLVPGLFSSLLLLLGIFFIYFFVGTLSFDWLSVYLFNMNQNINFNFEFNFLVFGFLCIVCSFCLKLNVVPFHTWVFWVYEGSLQHVVFFLSVIAKIFYFLIFFKYICPYLLFLGNLDIIFLLVGLGSILLSAFFGLFEIRFNNLLAFSGILNMGYIFLAISLYTEAGFIIAFFSILIYFIFSLFLYYFLVKSDFFIKGSFIKTIKDFKIFTFLNFSIFFFIIIIIFSIIGIPPLPGFYPKIFLFLNFFFNKNVTIFIILLLGVIFSSFFYLRWISYLNVGITLNVIEGWDFRYYLQGQKATSFSFLFVFILLVLSSFFFIDILLTNSSLLLLLDEC